MPTYAELKHQIKKMSQEAERLRKKELASIIKDVRTKIVEFGLTASDIGLNSLPRNRSADDVQLDRKKGSPKKSRVGRAERKPVPPKYADQKGNLWSGRGKAPRWMVEEISNGRSMNDFLINKNSPLLTKSF